MKNIQNILSFLAIIIASTFLNAQSTYTIGSTEYISGEYYSTTGKPKVVRSATNKKNFLRSAGYSSTPYGYEIDHITPLSEGGSDDPSNMQLLTVKQHKAKTSRERARRYNNSFSSTPKYTTSSTYNYSPTTSNNTNSKSFRTIYTGKNGGRYYVNSSGRKVYVKSKKQKSNNTYNYSTPSYSSYSSPSNSRIIQTGSRGGKYYVNSNGNKTYVKKN